MQHFASQEDAGNAILRDEIIIGEYFVIEGQGTFKRTEDHFFAQVSDANDVLPTAKFYGRTLVTITDTIDEHYVKAALPGAGYEIDVERIDLTDEPIANGIDDWIFADAYMYGVREDMRADAGIANVDLDEDMIETFAQFVDMFGLDQAVQMTRTLTRRVGKPYAEALRYNYEAAQESRVEYSGEAAAEDALDEYIKRDPNA